MGIHEDNWAAKLEHLHQAAIAVASAHEVDEALQTIADTAREVVNAEMAAIGVPGEPGEPMARFIVAGLSEEDVRRAGRPPMARGVLGVLLNDGQSVNIANIREHKDYLGVPAHHPQMTSFLGVPIRSSGEVIGDLYLANKIDAEAFTADDQRLAEMLAAHAAVVIANLRYQEQMQEVAVVREHARLAPRINDDVLQTLFGAGLLLNGLDYDDKQQTEADVREVQDRLDVAIQALRDHLMGLAQGDTKYP